MANNAVVFCGSKVACLGIKIQKHKSLEGRTSSSSKSVFNIDDYINLVNQSCKSLEKDTCYEEANLAWKKHDVDLSPKEGDASKPDGISCALSANPSLDLANAQQQDPVLSQLTEMKKQRKTSRPFRNISHRVKVEKAFLLARF